MTERFPRDTWYAIGGAGTLAPGDVMPVHLFGEERVAWRSDDGDCHIWQNRCVHRGMRLQYGFVDGDRLACRYHGWRFGGDGKCALIPAHPHMTPPDDYCVPTFSVAEASGLLWTAVGSPQGGPPEITGADEIALSRTVAIHASPAAAAGHLDGQGATYVSHGLSTVRENIEGENMELVLALQPVGDEKCQLHVSVRVDASGSDHIGSRRRAAAWARRIRDRIEAEVGEHAA